MIKRLIKESVNEIKFKGRTFKYVDKGSYIEFEYLDVSDMGLNSLKELPWSNKNYVVNGDFNCSYNKLTNLQGGPQKVGNNFFCNYNNLTSLQGAPKEVGGNFGGNFFCDYNKVKFTEDEVRLVSNVRGRIYV
jgi:hypothetical protein